VAVFLAQLEERAWPLYPTHAWWSALAFADRDDFAAKTGIRSTI
jgi:hypothetical protein